MAIPESLKFDVRVRDRLLKKGLLTDTEVEQHLSSLPDRSEDALDIGIKQPALQTEAEREVIVVRTLARPVQPAPPPRMFGDDDDAYVEEKPRAAAAGAGAGAAAAAAAVDDDDLDDEDDDDLDDEDDDDLDDEKTVENVAKKAEKDESAEPGAEPGAEPKKEETTEKVDDDWG